MLIIPVIDISHGLVVHAKKGSRDLYRPVTSVISSKPDPVSVISSYLELYPFKIFYIADLDAIQGNERQDELITTLALDYKQCEFWLDAGLDVLKDSNLIYKAKNIKPVLGSENKFSKETFVSLTEQRPNIILSLDFNQDGFIENNYLLEETSIWPKQIILMMLHRVGSNVGIDMPCLENVLTLAEGKEVYSAGGIRNIDDLKLLKTIGVKGVLLASALHSGDITKEDLINILEK
jgi:phosphoribosylformimino-5-aminoimidazole carboxamide ribotide isomerase